MTDPYPSHTCALRFAQTSTNDAVASEDFC